MSPTHKDLPLGPDPYYRPPFQEVYDARRKKVLRKIGIAVVTVIVVILAFLLLK